MATARCPAVPLPEARESEGAVDLAGAGTGLATARTVAEAAFALVIVDKTGAVAMLAIA